MKTTRTFWVTTLLCASACTSVSGSSGFISPRSMAEQITDAHNRVREEMGVPPLSWSPKIAAYVQKWADHLAEEGCQMVHRTENEYGENLFWQSAVIWSDGRKEISKISPTEAVTSWADEKKDYRYNSNSCRSGKMCGHYTQVVWADSKEVGCAMQVCSDRGQIWVCNYSPPGNWVGRKPY